MIGNGRTNGKLGRQRLKGNLRGCHYWFGRFLFFESGDPVQTGVQLYLWVFSEPFLIVFMVKFASFGCLSLD